MTTFAAVKRAVWGRAWLILGFMSILYGANGTAARLAVGQMSPLLLVFFRWVFTVVLIGAALRLNDWRELRDLVRTHWIFVGWMSLVGLSGFNILFYIAAYYTTAVNITLMQCAIPALVLAGSAIVFRTRIRALQLVGLSFTFLGVLIVVAKGDLSRLSSFAFDRGDVLVLISCVLYAAYALGLRTRPPGSRMVFFAATAIASLVWSLPTAVAEIALGQAYWPSAEGWLVTFLIALGPSFIGTLCFMRGVDLIGPARTGLFVNLVPIFGALIAVIVLHETFTLAHAVAVVLGLGGITLAEWRGPKSRLVLDAEPASDPHLP